MRNPVELTLRGVTHSGALELFISEQAHKLDRLCDRIQACQVMVEAVHRPKQQGAQFAVRLNITLPGMEVVVNREHGEDVYMALRDAFEAAGVQLQDRAGRRGGAGRRSNSGTPNPGR